LRKLGPWSESPIYANAFYLIGASSGLIIGLAGLFLLNRTTGQVTRLAPREDQDNVNLPGSAWNAATGRIVFASDRAEADDLWWIAPNNSDFRRVISHSGPA